MSKEKEKFMTDEVKSREDKKKSDDKSFNPNRESK